MREEESNIGWLRNPITWGIFLTFLLGCLVVYLGFMLGTDGKPRYVEFLNGQPNTIGDTLAGIFAPLAFIWIVVTVFLQSHELREQRKELSFSREELKLAREAQEAQLQVMQKQADIFADEKRRRDQAVAHHYVESLLTFLADILSDRNFQASKISIYKYVENEKVLRNIYFDWGQNIPEPTNARLREIARRIGKRFPTWEVDLTNATTVRIDDELKRQLEDIYFSIDELSRSETYLDSIGGASLRLIRFSDLKVYFDAVRTLSDGKPE